MSYYDIQRLRNTGYEVIEQSPWHFQIEGHVILNIWPSKKKYMVKWDKGASFYTDVVKTVESILGKPGEMKPEVTMFDIMKEEYEDSMSEEENIAFLDWSIWRCNFSFDLVDTLLDSVLFA